jgi:hypothetical protein
LAVISAFFAARASVFAVALAAASAAAFFKVSSSSAAASAAARLAARAAVAAAGRGLECGQLSRGLSDAGLLRGDGVGGLAGRRLAQLELGDGGLERVLRCLQLLLRGLGDGLTALQLCLRGLDVVAGRHDAGVSCAGGSDQLVELALRRRELLALGVGGDRCRVGSVLQALECSGGSVDELLLRVDLRLEVVCLLLEVGGGLQSIVALPCSTSISSAFAARWSVRRCKSLDGGREVQLQSLLVRHQVRECLLCRRVGHREPQLLGLELGEGALGRLDIGGEPGRRAPRAPRARPASSRSPQRSSRRGLQQVGLHLAAVGLLGGDPVADAAAARGGGRRDAAEARGRPRTGPGGRRRRPPGARRGWPSPPPGRLPSWSGGGGGCSDRERQT